MLGVTSYILPGEQTGLLGSSQFEPGLFAQALATIKPESLVLTPALLLALIFNQIVSLRVAEHGLAKTMHREVFMSSHP